MSLNLDRVGKFLAQVEGGKYDRKIVSVTSELKVEEDGFSRPFSQLTIDGKFQQIPNPETEREILYITGASGSGKSTYTANYIRCYKRMFSKNKIYCFSALKDDESLDVVKPKRITIDDRLISDPLQCEDFKNSLVVFDDIDVISDKKQREAVYNILNQMLETGRHFKVTVIITNHLATAGNDTRRVLNECHSVTYFPFSGSNVGTKRLLENYLGLDKDTIKKIKMKKSRWATVFKNYPQVIMTEKDVWLPSEDTETSESVVKDLKNPLDNRIEQDTDSCDNTTTEKNLVRKK